MQFFLIVKDPRTEFMQHFGVFEKEKYDMAWVFTDGAGTEINIPEAAREKWHWFLTPKMITNLIPKKCNIHFLSKFVLPKGS